MRTAKACHPLRLRSPRTQHPWPYRPPLICPVLLACGTHTYTPPPSVAAPHLAPCSFSRSSLQTMDESGGDQPIDHAHYDSDGELGEEHIFCSKCGEYESCDDNDIILCDGNCRRAYHQKCVMPPIDLDAIAEDEPWLCPACDAKDDATEFINDEFGTEYTLETPWRELFIEPQRGGVAGAHAGGGGITHMLLGEDLPSDDEDDMDFDVAGEGPSDSNDSDGSSSSESERNGGGSDSNTGCLDDISDGSEGEEQDREDELRSLQEEAETCLEGRQTQGKQKTASPLLVRLPAKRRRKAVDYKALNQAMFGDMESYDGEGGDDDEWSPTADTPTKRL
mmetsp:Transcript_1674/g.4824  ORF Transcript_1674/g.4824 Transcript_1674/m.4824 type:complete len:336 (+) Transcript_1674:180-1187(+)